MGAFLRDVMKLNMEARNFRLFSPDENNSNRWQDALEVTNRAWVAETYPWDDFGPSGITLALLLDRLAIPNVSGPPRGRGRFSSVECRA